MASDKPAVLIAGMHGLGDNLHQRAIIRQLLPRFDLYLQSSWVSVYHDLVPEGLKVVRKNTELRFQTRNQAREDTLFYKGDIPPHDLLPIWYRPEQVNELGSVLAAMCYSTKTNPDIADFHLPIPKSWGQRIRKVLAETNVHNKPIMVYRPLIERIEWGGCAARNPDKFYYHDLFSTICKDFFIVSIADLAPRVEWISSFAEPADLTFHRGELPFEELAALFQEASLVFCSPGFAAPLSQAVGTPSAVVFGGFETGTSFTLGAKNHGVPHLSIAPINPCGCWRHNHECDKRIDMPRARHFLKAFANEHASAYSRQTAVA